MHAFHARVQCALAAASSALSAGAQSLSVSVVSVSATRDVAIGCTVSLAWEDSTLLTDEPSTNPVEVYVCMYVCAPSYWHTSAVVSMKWYVLLNVIVMRDGGGDFCARDRSDWFQDNWCISV